MPQRIEDDADNKPTGAENKSARSCMGDLLGTLFGMQQNMAGRPYTSDTLKEELSRKQVDPMAGGSWRDGSTIAGSEAGLEREHGRSGVENVGSVASNLGLSEFGSPGHHVNNPSHADDHDHTEIALPDAYGRMARCSKLQEFGLVVSGEHLEDALCNLDRSVNRTSTAQYV